MADRTCSIPSLASWYFSRMLERLGRRRDQPGPDECSPVGSSEAPSAPPAPTPESRPTQRSDTALHIAATYPTSPISPAPSASTPSSTPMPLSQPQPVRDSVPQESEGQELARQTQTPKTALSYFDESRYPRGPQDVYLAASALQRLGLPAELRAMVLDAAEYWPVVRFCRTRQKCVYPKRNGDVYMATSGLGHDQQYDPGREDKPATVRPGCISKVVLTVVAHEKWLHRIPWSGVVGDNEQGTRRDGMNTWFELCVYKDGVFRPPQEERRRLIGNVHGYECFHTQRAEISQYDADPALADLVRGLRRGDRILVTAHCSIWKRCFAHVNVVREAEVEVYYSFV